MKRASLGLWFAGLLLVCSALQAQEVRFPVRHDRLLRDRTGELIFSETGIEYRTKDKGDARTWKYEDVQQLGLLSPKELTILAYQDSKWKFGKDLFYRFKITEGEMTPALWTELQAKLKRPVVSAIIPPDIAPNIHDPGETPAGIRRHAGNAGDCRGVYHLQNRYAERLTHLALPGHLLDRDYRALPTAAYFHGSCRKRKWWRPEFRFFS